MTYNCPICGKDIGSSRIYHREDDSREFKCPKCGDYAITQGLLSDFDRHFNDPIERMRLSYIIRKSTDILGKLEPTLSGSNINTIMSSRLIPLKVHDKIGELLRYLGNNLKDISELTQAESCEVWCSRLCLHKEESLLKLLDYLESRKGQIQLTRDGPNIRIGLSINGWLSMDTLISSTVSNQAFVAMWFVPEMFEIYDKCIKPAVEAAGLSPFLVFREPKGIPIDDEIISEIRRSKVIIADATGERQCVYFEAGFGYGLGIPVVWCCSESWSAMLPENILCNSKESPRLKEVCWKDRLHFDTRQYPHIFWKDANDLKKALIERIRAWGLAEKR